MGMLGEYRLAIGVVLILLTAAPGGQMTERVGGMGVGWEG